MDKLDATESGDSEKSLDVPSSFASSPDDDDKKKGEGKGKRSKKSRK